MECVLVDTSKDFGVRILVAEARVVAPLHLVLKLPVRPFQLENLDFAETQKLVDVASLKAFHLHLRRVSAHAEGIAPMQMPHGITT